MRVVALRQHGTAALEYAIDSPRQPRAHALHPAGQSLLAPGFYDQMCVPVLK